MAEAFQHNSAPGSLHKQLDHHDESLATTIAEERMARSESRFTVDTHASTVTNSTHNSSSATLTTPVSQQPTEYSEGISPTTLANFNITKSLMEEDECEAWLDDLFGFRSSNAKERKLAETCIEFLYGFFAKRHFVRVHELENDSNDGTNTKKFAFTKIDDSPTKEDRQSLRNYLVKDEANRGRLHSIAAVQIDQNLLSTNHPDRNVYNAIGRNYVRTLLRFFEMEGTKGFLTDMTKATHSICLQSKHNCFEVAACELIDLKAQRDFDLSDKISRIDKARVSRRIMSPEELCDYVINDAGGDGLKYVQKVLNRGAHDGMATFSATFSTGGNATVFDAYLQGYIDCFGPTFLSFQVGRGLEEYASTVPTIPVLDETIDIPCFDGNEMHSRAIKTPFDLKKLAVNEKERLNHHFQADANPPRTPLNEFGQACFVGGDSPTDVGFDCSGNSFQGILKNLFPKKLWPTKWGSSPLSDNDNKEHDDYDCAAHNGINRHGANNNDDDKAAFHAVVCLGYALDKDMKVWYLMKNSWEKMPLFLATASYLSACNAFSFAISRPLVDAKNTLGDYTKQSSVFTQCHLPRSRSLPPTTVQCPIAGLEKTSPVRQNLEF